MGDARRQDLAARRRSTSSSFSGVRSLNTATAPSTVPSGSRRGEVVHITGRERSPPGSSISGSVRATPSAALANSGSLRQGASCAVVPPLTSSAARPVSRSAARLNIAMRPADVVATTPLSIVATMFSMYSFASTTCAYSRAFLMAMPAWFASVIRRSRSCE